LGPKQTILYFATDRTQKVDFPAALAQRAFIIAAAVLQPPVF
jgi:hypothetical protein